MSIYALIIIFAFTSCNQLSEGVQRKKFEYLYKLNNYASLFREYTNGLNTYEDLDFYENRIKKLYEDINKMEPLNEWGQSKTIKGNFLANINENLKSVDIIRQKQRPLSNNIRKEYDVLLMNERANKFVEELNDEISKAGKD